MKPYQSAQDVWWRLRHDSGGDGGVAAVYCETSPDGRSWTPFTDAEIGLEIHGLPPPKSVHMRITVGHGPGDSSPGQLVLANLSGGGGGSWCTASSFTDDFSKSNAPDLPVGWDNAGTNNGGTYDQDGGTLNLHVGPGNVTADYGSSAAYDMTGQRISLQVLSVVPVADGQSTFALSTGPYNTLTWSLNQEMFSCSLSGQSYVLKASPPPLPAWISFKENAGAVSCDLLSDAGSWMSLGSFTLADGGLDPSAVGVTIGASGGGAGGQLETMSFANYNLGPP